MPGPDLAIRRVRSAMLHEPEPSQVSPNPKTRRTGRELVDYAPRVGPAPAVGPLLFRVGTEADAAAVNQLHNLVFDQRRGLEQLRWKLFHNPDGPALLHLACERTSGRVVGVHVGVPRLFRVDGRDVRFVQNCETAIHPDWRGLGTFRHTVGGFALHAAARGLPVSYGAQINDAGYKLGIRLFGYHEFFRLPTWERRLSLRPALGRRLGPTGELLGTLAGRLRPLPPEPPERGLRFAIAAAFDEEFDRLWERLRDRQRVARVRDAVRQTWRFAACPVGAHRIWKAYRGDRLEGYLVYRDWVRDGVRLATALDWLDGGDPAVIAALSSRAARDAAARGCDFFQIAALEDSTAARALAELRGFALSPREPLDRVVGMVMPLGDRGFREHAYLAAAFEPGAWHYTQGDVDFRD